MKASVMDFRHRMKDILKALDRNEPVTLLYRGKERGVLMPLPRKESRPLCAETKFFGIWRDRKDMADPAAYVRELRKGRSHAD